MTIKYTNSFHCKIFQKLPKLGYFWSENMPSGNPALEADNKKVNWTTPTFSPNHRFGFSKNLQATVFEKFFSMRHNTYFVTSN
jgi:hypothetical protein